MTNPVRSTLMIGVYSLLFVRFFRGAIAVRPYWGARVAVTVLTAMAIHFFFYWEMNTLGVAVYFIAFTLLFWLVLQTTPMVALFAGSLFSISIFSSRSIAVGVMAMALKKTVSQVMGNAPLYYIALGSAIVLSASLWGMVRRFLANSTKFRQLLNNREQLRFVALTHVILMLFLLLVHDGMQWDLRRAWYVTLFLFSGLLCKATSMFVFNHALRVSVLLEYELHTRQMKEQLARQIQHYESYQKFTESFRTFRHDYKHMMAAVTALLRKGDTEQALRLMNQISQSMHQTVQIHKTYSNNFVLDAILQDAANACLNAKIRFEAALPVPTDMPLDELDTVRLFTNVVNNAIEACSKTPAPERFLEIKGHYNQRWMYIVAKNSYDGKPLHAKGNGAFSTTKPDRGAHGYGLSIIQNIVTAHGGVVLVDADCQQNVFTVTISIPRDVKTTAPD